MSTSTTSTTAIPANHTKPKRAVGTWLKRGVFGLAITMFGLGGIGAIYQAIATANDERTYTPAGQMVDIGGRRIHMVVMGRDTGQATVILEAGMASFSSNYYWIQNKLADTTRVVAYDRAGLGWSDPSPEPQDAYQSAQDLHTALVKAGIPGPYVVAGHSYGGLVVRAFTDLYADEVVGMALIDASHPDQWAQIPVSREGKFNGNANLFTAFLARLGVVRFFQLEKASYAGLPERQAGEMEAILARPESWQRSGEVLLIWNDRTRPQINQARSLGDLPLAVLSVTEQPIYGEVLTRLQNELPSLSSNSVHYTVAGATHENLVSEREHALMVAEAIRSVMEVAQTGRPLSEVFGTEK
jgi:pimeloyl-ACP methyl ester carboxylesterase